MPKKREFNHGDRDSRERRHFERLGTDKPFCLLCDCPWACAIELHHIAQRQYYAEEIPLCAKHHKVASDRQYDHPGKIDGCINPAETVGHILLGLNDLVEIAADELPDPRLGTLLGYLRLKLKENGLFLIELARRTPDIDVGIQP